MSDNRKPALSEPTQTARLQTGDAVKHLLQKVQQPVCKIHRLLKACASDTLYSQLERDTAGRIGADLENHFAYLQRWVWRLKQGLPPEDLEDTPPNAWGRKGKAKGRRQLPVRSDRRR